MVEKEYIPDLGGLPERMKSEGVRDRYNNRIKIGDTVEARVNVENGKVPKGAIAKVVDIFIEPKGNVRGFDRSITIEGFDGEFNPASFKKIEE